MTKKMLNPKKYLNGNYHFKNCNHLVATENGFDEGLYGNFYECLICKTSLIFPYFQRLDESFIITKYNLFDHYYDDVAAIYEMALQEICLKNIYSKEIDIVKYLNTIKPIIDEYVKIDQKNNSVRKQALK